MTSDWPFDQPRNCATFVTRHVIEGVEPILFVSHDADDHGWSFVGVTNVNLSDARLVALSRILDLDPSISEIADLPPGWDASRDAIGRPWTRSPSPPDEVD